MSMPSQKSEVGVTAALKAFLRSVKSNKIIHAVKIGVFHATLHYLDAALIRFQAVRICQKYCNQAFALGTIIFDNQSLQPSRDTCKYRTC